MSEQANAEREGVSHEAVLIREESAQIACVLQRIGDVAKRRHGVRDQ